LAKNVSACAGQSGNDLELCQGAGGCDGSAPQAREVVAVRAGDALDQAKQAQAPKLTREARVGVLGEEHFEVGAAYAMDVELRALQGAQQFLLGGGEEVQSLDSCAAAR